MVSLILIFEGTDENSDLNVERKLHCFSLESKMLLQMTISSMIQALSQEKLRSTGKTKTIMLSQQDQKTRLKSWKILYRS